eukprot:11159036-Lingulodinium_polyedra.AAC.1
MLGLPRQGGAKRPRGWAQPRHPRARRGPLQFAVPHCCVLRLRVATIRARGMAGPIAAQDAGPG